MRERCGARRCTIFTLVMLCFLMVYENLIVVERNPRSPDPEAGATLIIETTAARLDFSSESGGGIGGGGGRGSGSGSSGAALGFGGGV